MKKKVIQFMLDNFDEFRELVENRGARLLEAQHSLRLRNFSIQEAWSAQVNLEVESRGCSCCSGEFKTVRIDSELLWMTPERFEVHINNIKGNKEREKQERERKKTSITG